MILRRTLREACRQRLCAATLRPTTATRVYGRRVGVQWRALTDDSIPPSPPPPHPVAAATATATATAAHVAHATHAATAADANVASAADADADAAANSAGNTADSVAAATADVAIADVATADVATADVATADVASAADADADAAANSAGNTADSVAAATADVAIADVATADVATAAHVAHVAHAAHAATAADANVTSAADADADAAEVAAAAAAAVAVATSATADATPTVAPPVNPILSSHHSISFDGRKIHIPWATGKTSTFHHIWLRDHCRCPECFKSATNQRLLDTYSIPTDVKPEKAEAEKEGLQIEWKDGHKSFYSWGWLTRYSYAPKIEEPFHSPKHLWGSEIKETPPVVQFEDVMKDDMGVANWTSKIDKYGFCYVEGVPTTPEDTQKLVERIAFIRQTHWGGFYDFTSNLAHHDMAYTNLPLPAHTDNTYFTDPAGLQLFHLLSSDGDGGNSLLVDGFKAARQMRDEHPEAYKFLSTVRIPAHSAGDDGICIRPSVPSHGFPVFNHDSLTGDLFQVRWNNEDRSTMSHWSDVDDVEAFYDAIRHWNAVLRNPENEYWAPYEPGKAVIFDNWRVLHGRSAFTGNNRRLCGAYIGMDDFRSRLRMTNMEDAKEWL